MKTAPLAAMASSVKIGVRNERVGGELEDRFAVEYM